MSVLEKRATRNSQILCAAIRLRSMCARRTCSVSSVCTQASQIRLRCGVRGARTRCHVCIRGTKSRCRVRGSSTRNGCARHSANSLPHCDSADLDNPTQPVYGLSLLSSAIESVHHDALWFSLVNEVRKPRVHEPNCSVTVCDEYTGGEPPLQGTESQPGVAIILRRTPCWSSKECKRNVQSRPNQRRQF